MSNEYPAWAKAWFRRVNDEVLSATEPVDIRVLLAEHRPLEWIELRRRQEDVG